VLIIMSQVVKTNPKQSVYGGCCVITLYQSAFYGILTMVFLWYANYGVLLNSVTFI